MLKIPPLETDFFRTVRSEFDTKQRDILFKVRTEISLVIGFLLRSNREIKVIILISSRRERSVSRLGLSSLIFQAGKLGFLTLSLSLEHTR